jgi:hypothetical protein
LQRLHGAVPVLRVAGSLTHDADDLLDADDLDRATSDSLFRRPGAHSLLVPTGLGPGEASHVEPKLQLIEWEQRAALLRDEGA